MQRFEQTPRPAAVVVAWRHKETRWVCCTARRTKASQPTLTAFGLAAKRRAEYASVNLYWYFVFHTAVTDWCRCCCARLLLLYESTRKCPRRGRRRVRFPRSLDPSPCQPTVVRSRRDAPPTDRASGAKQRRCVTIQLIDRSAAACSRG